MPNLSARTIAIASNFRVDRAKLPEFPQKEWVGARKAQLEANDFPSRPRVSMQQCLACLRNR